jgi:hypothetical protein
MAANCAKDYKDFWDNLARSSFAKQATGDQIAQVSRYALRGYDACSAGDERFTSKKFFEQLERSNFAKPEDIFRELERSGMAKQK